MTSEPIAFGEKKRVLGNFSEAAMHLRISHKVIDIELVGNPEYPMVQVYEPGGERISFPITIGEAGVFEDAKDHEGRRRWYCYPVRPFVGQVFIDGEQVRLLSIYANDVDEARRFLQLETAGLSKEHAVVGEVFDIAASFDFIHVLSVTGMFPNSLPKEVK